MRKNIIQSKTEPNKNDIWLSEEGLKRYGKNGWEPLGGGSTNDSTSVGAKETYILEITNDKTDYDKLKEAVFDNKIIIFINTVCTALYEETDTGEGIYIMGSVIDASILNIGVNCNVIYVSSNGSCEFETKYLELVNKGSGTKFLSDDGTYKKVSGGSGPVIIDMIGESGSVTDEQIEAAKNGNIKIKVSSEIGITYVLPYYYLVQEDAVIFCVRLGDSDFYDSIFKIDIINKTISAYIKE